MSPDPVDDLVDVVASRWWSPVIRGIAAILFGIFALARPGAGLAALVLVWAVYAIIDGVFNIALAIQRGQAGARWGWFLFEGLVSIAAGVLTFAMPQITAIVLLYVIAVWAFVTGFAELAGAWALRGAGGTGWLLGLAGALSIAFGVLLVLNPRSGALAVVGIIGAYAIIFGILLVTLGVRLHRVHTEHGTPTGVPTAA